MSFHRIVIVGNPASGKSTLSAAWGRITGLPVVHWDLLQWQPNWTLNSEAELARVQAEILRQEHWLVEGYGTDEQLKKTLAAADQIIYLDTPLDVCVERAQRRMEEQKHTPNPFTATSCRYVDIWQEHIDFIAYFHKKVRPLILHLLAADFAGKTQVHLDGRLPGEELCLQLKNLRQRDAVVKCEFPVA